MEPEEHVVQYPGLNCFRFQFSRSPRSFRLLSRTVSGSEILVDFLVKLRGSVDSTGDEEEEEEGGDETSVLEEDLFQESEDAEVKITFNIIELSLTLY